MKKPEEMSIDELKVAIFDNVESARQGQANIEVLETELGKRRKESKNKDTIAVS